MGTRRFITAVLASVLAMPLLTAGAWAAGWSIERMSGDVQIHNGESWIRLDAGRQLVAGDSIWTGRNGRILLRNDQGSVLLAPESLVKIPAQALPNNFSVLFQTHGTVSAEVDKRRSQHFSIQTPYLAAVVKGTEFDVETGRKSTSVSVSEGLVGVVDPQTGETVDVPAGSAVSATASGGLGQAVAAAASGGSSASTNSAGGNSGGGNSGGGSSGGDSGDRSNAGNGNDGGNGNAYAYAYGKGNGNAYGRNRDD